MRPEYMDVGDENCRLIDGIRRQGWRQGSVVPADLVRQMSDVPPGTPPDGNGIYWLVLSHDCDIVHHDLGAEPNIEIISFTTVESPDGNLLHGKNPRRLHLSDPSGTRHFEFEAKSRRFCSRKHLAKLPPDLQMRFSNGQIRDLVKWIALRYVRTAFPDAFNIRLRPAAAKLGKLLKSDGKFIASIFVAMDLRELASGETYNLILYILMRDEDFGNPSRKTSAHETSNQIEALINGKCHGIMVKESSVRSEGEITVADLRMLHRLEFDYLSHVENNVPPSPRA